MKFNKSIIAAAILAIAACETPAVACVQAPAAERASSAMLAQAMAAVVQIDVVRDGGADPFATAKIGPVGARPSIGRGRARAGGGGGSGFVIDASGLIATNAHVVAEAETITVRLRDGREFTARVVGSDPVLDLAMLRIAADAPLPVLQFAPSAALAQGERVWAIGAPMGYGFSVTSGVLSGRDRFYDHAFPVALLQHDAPLNPGNSGGPLLNAQGRVIGINTATPPETLFDIGIGLSIPSETAAIALQRLARDGRIARGSLGVSVATANADVARALNAPEPGVLVDQIAEGGAAAAAGLQVGDLLTRIDDKGLSTPRDVVRALLDSTPGARVRLTYFRGGVTRIVEVVLSGDPAAAATAAARPDAPLALGLSFADMPARRGVAIAAVSPDSVAQRYGLQAGDVIRSIDGVDPPSAAAVSGRLRSGQARVAVLRVERPGVGARHIVLPLTRAAAAARPPGRVVDAAAGPF